MKNYMYFVLSIILMIFGEVATIYSELYAAKLPATISGHGFDFSKPMLLICIAGICLVFSYWLGCHSTGNIWVVTVLSLTMLLVLEPLVIYLMFQELPARGALIGFVLGALGLIATLFL